MIESAPTSPSSLLDRPVTPAQTEAALSHLLTVVQAGNPFYQAKLEPIRGSLDTVDSFRRHCPFTTKAELVANQEQYPPYGNHLSHPIEHYTRCHQTSGTTGAPLRWLDTPASWNVMVADWLKVFRAAGITQSDRILFAFSFGPFLGFWLAFEAAHQMGTLVFAGGGMTSLRRLHLLLENQCTVLCCTPTYALHLSETAARESIDLSTAGVHTVLVAGEPGGSLPSVRQRISESWHGARVFDHHGMTETGPVTFEHPDQPGDLVVMESSFLAEILDPETNEPVSDGQEGELVLTTLQRAANPLLRYRTGDLVRPHRDNGYLLLRGGILGRVDDMQIVRGVNVHPSAIEAVIRKFPDIIEYRVTCDRRSPLTQLLIEIEGTDTDARHVGTALQEAFALRIPVQAVSTGSLPRFEMKARRWRTLPETAPSDEISTSAPLSVLEGKPTK